MEQARKFGYLKDPVDTRDLNLRSLKLPQTLPRVFSLRRHILQILDQQGSSTCVTQALALTIQTAERARGVFIEIPSRLFMYHNSCRQYGEEVTDSGTYPRNALAGVQKLGAPPETLWPFSDKETIISRQPSWDAYMHAYARRGGGYWKIFDTGTSLVEAIKGSIVDLHPVTFGTIVTKDFLEEDGPIVVPTPKSTDKIAGSHAMSIIGYETTQSGRILFELANSWGTKWRNLGYCVVSEEYIKLQQSTDFVSVRGWESIRNV